MEKVLITGASGFIGYHLVRASLDAGLEVHAAIRKSSDVSHMAGLDIKYVIPEYSDAWSLRNLIEDRAFDYIIHAAGITRAKNEREYNRINADYTRNIAWAAEGTDVKKFVFLSSLAALGPTSIQDPNPICEEKEPRPLTSYGKSKLLAEQYLKLIDIPKIIFRPTAVYGPRDRDIFILFQILQRRLEAYIGRGQQRFSFVHAADMAAVAVQALFSDVKNGVYNISDGRLYGRYELADIIKQQLGRKTLKLHVPMSLVRLLAASLEQLYRRSDKAPTLNKEKLAELSAENWNCSIERAQRELGFAPRFDLRSGVADTISWYKRNRWL